MGNLARIPRVDLSAFFSGDDEQGKSAAKETISRACAEYGFFQVANHGIPLDLMSRAMELSKTFFGLPDDEKLKNSPRAGAPVPAGYGKQPEQSADKNEYLMMLPPHNTLNVLPINPPGFRALNKPNSSVKARLDLNFIIKRTELKLHFYWIDDSQAGSTQHVDTGADLRYPYIKLLFVTRGEIGVSREALEEMFTYLSRTGEMMASILNDCLGLPPNFLKEYNQDRGWDLMSAKRYFPATDTENIGISKHEDSNILTFIFQDEVGGLEVLRNGQWIPVVPSQDTLVVNIGDIIQVMTNNKFKSATHRVTRPQGRSRYSFSFFYNLRGDKWVEPLPHFTTQIGEPPKYKGFLYKDYLALRIRNKTHPPSKPEDEINITHYAISTNS
ncbi:flavonol synthase/flavanone 3-hydroxylase [Phtheirospermum japonicum]|uniref:Flavonol synthase/flavanone 3-hydroxylase n=1 Tax=Phtheirospermum japonicum TaxID=374723 RepID=A0A830CWH2_9LAMI|nr:flavonol synthase/flavanone 3-hydroxylase [Phtheirospermum japonicum]